LSDIFAKRMAIQSRNGQVGEFLRNSTNTVENFTFTNNINYKKGMLYDWDMNPIEEVEFKFEKHRTFVSEEREVEYFIRFRPDFHPELKYKDRYYKNDGRARLGFYIDVPDYDEGTIGKWIISGKDDKSTLDRYNCFKCNWCFEWIGKDKKYYTILGALRDSNNSTAKDVNNTLLDGSIISGDTSFLMPSNKISQQVDLGTRFMIGDRTDPPQVYEVIKITDTAPLGTAKVYLRQCMWNEHTDIQGDVNNMTNYDFYFDLPIPNLPEGFGNNNHSIAGAIRNKALSDTDVPETKDDVSWKLQTESNYIYYGEIETVIKAVSDFPTNSKPQWHISIDGQDYSYEELEGYFVFNETNHELHIECTNKDMIGYIIKISIYDSAKTYYDSIEREVHL